MEFILVFITASAIIGPAAYFLGLRRRAPVDETNGDTMRIMLSGPSTKPPRR